MKGNDVPKTDVYPFINILFMKRIIFSQQDTPLVKGGLWVSLHSKRFLSVKEVSFYERLSPFTEDWILEQGKLPSTYRGLIHKRMFYFAEEGLPL